MCIEGLRTRLISLSKSLRQDQQLIARLSKLPHQVGSVASDEQDARAELSSGIHQSLKDHEEELDLLRQEVDDQFQTPIRSALAQRHASGAHNEKTDVAAQLAGLAQDLKITHIQFRKAQLTAKRNAEAAKRREREILFADLRGGTDAPLGSHGRRKGQEKLTKDEILLSASSDVTAALRRAHRLMGQELERSQFASQTLESSTRDLNTLSESYSNLNTLLSSSRSLVSTLIHSQKSDTWYLESSFFVLCFSIAWLVFRRLIYGPGWWLLYLPLDLFWKLSIAALKFVLAFLPSFAASTGSQQQSKALTPVNSSIQSEYVQSSALRSTTLSHDFQTKMPEPSGGADATSRNDAGRESDAIPEMIEKVLEDTGTLSKTAAEDGGTETKLRARQADEAPNPKKRMWELRQQQPSQGPQEQLEPNIFAFNLAGHETTANTIASSLVLLAANPSYQSWLAEEIDQAWNSSAHYEDVFPKLKRCLAVMYEMLRLYGSIVFIPKSTGVHPQSVTLHDKSHLLPAGTAVNINVQALHTDREIWGADALQWRPSRWIEHLKSPQSVITADPAQGIEQLVNPESGIYVPWADGPRVCIGRKFFQVEFVAVIASLFGKARVRPVLKTKDNEEDGRRALMEMVEESSIFAITLQMKNPKKVALMWEHR